MRPKTVRSATLFFDNGKCFDVDKGKCLTGQEKGIDMDHWAQRESKVWTLIMCRRWRSNSPDWWVRLKVVADYTEQLFNLFLCLQV